MQFKLLNTHPRVLVTADSLPVLRERARTTHRAEMDLLLTAADAEKPGERKPDPWGRASSLAFLYLLTEKKAHAAACINALEDVLEQDFNGFSAGRLRPVAWAYDWLHDVLPESLRIR